MKHYLFSEVISGEQFLIGANSEKEANIIAESIADEIGHQWNNDKWVLAYYGEVTEEEAEDSGLDEY